MRLLGPGRPDVAGGESRQYQDSFEREEIFRHPIVELALFFFLLSFFFFPTTIIRPQLKSSSARHQTFPRCWRFRTCVEINSINALV